MKKESILHHSHLYTADLMKWTQLLATGNSENHFTQPQSFDITKGGLEGPDLTNTLPACADTCMITMVCAVDTSK